MAHEHEWYPISWYEDGLPGLWACGGFHCNETIPPIGTTSKRKSARAVADFRSLRAAAEEATGLRYPEYIDSEAKVRKRA